jgi:tol-pal system protein YbgF
MRRPFVHKLTGVSLVVMVLMMAGSASVQAQSSDSSAAAAAEVRFQALEKEIRRLTGQVEEQNYKIKQLEEEVARQTGDLQVRIGDIENKTGGGAPMATGGGEPAPQPQQDAAPAYTANTDAGAAEIQNIEEPIDAPSESASTHNSSSFYTPPPSRQDGQLGTLNQSTETGEVTGGSSEAAEYEQAYAYIKSRDFEAAEGAFEAFIAKYPSSSYMTNAKYWYGETFFVRGNYEKAARVFAESYQANPKGNKAAGNLLKLGMSLAGMGKKDDACVAFKQLQKDYASSAVPILKRADTEMRRIGCK